MEFNLILFALIRSAVMGEALSDKEKAMFSENMLPELIRISKMHDLAHLVSYGIMANNLILPDNKYYTYLEQEQFAAVYRYEQINYDFEELSSVLEKNAIPFLPLKGSVMRRYYREAWMRTSCDIDILIKPEDLQRATDILINQCGYEKVTSSLHDISFKTPSKQNVELHHMLVEKGKAVKSNDILRSVWDRASLRDGFGYWYEMTDEMFFFHHIAHMAKHFEDGGCGIRPFIDLWILKKNEGCDEKSRNELIQTAGLSKFMALSERMTEVWFEGRERDNITSAMETFIITGGTFGTTETHCLMKHHKSGGTVGYIIEHIFLPYGEMIYQYPILKEHKWLLPFMEVARWFRLVFLKDKKSVVEQIENNRDMYNSDETGIKLFLNEIGL